ncbi:MAG: lysostaphin resistance A-like protein [Candidatus Rokuibacteriota bacterium]
MLRGLLAWLLVCVAFVGLEAAGLAEGLALPVPLIAALVLARALGESAWARRHATLVVVVVALGAAELGLTAWWYRLAPPAFSPGETAAALLAAAAATALLAPRAVRAALMPPLGLDPGSPVHAVVLVAGVATLASSAMLFVALRDEAAASLPFYVSDSVVAVATDAALVLAGVGFLLTRDARTVRERLDLRPLGPRLAAWAVAAALAFHVVMGALEWTERVVLPELHALEDRFDYEFVGIPPLVGVVLVSVAAGVGEELLFRGALQPRVGVVASAALFAALHVQYQVPGVLMIFAVGLALGVLKQRTSTTFTMLVHVVYDLGAFSLDFLE